MTRPRSGPARLLWLIPSLLVVPGAVSAQLRPLDPLDWRLLDQESYSISVGAGLFGGQRASLAGTKGRLMELGTFRAGWSLGRVSLQLAGTVLRVFDDQSVFTDPAPDTRPPDGSRRIDTGDYRVSTVVRLSPDGADGTVALRFGVRLPTTDNVVGLERDQTDFFSTLAGRIERGRWTWAAEAGIGILGTRDLRHEQVDPFLFGVVAEYDLSWASAILEFTGQHDTRRGRDLRGTENIGEGRLGLRTPGPRWMEVTVVRGWTPFSPDYGIRVRMGTRF